MDVTCRKCGEPWDAHHLNWDMAFMPCAKCDFTIYFSERDNLWHLTSNSAAMPLSLARGMRRCADGKHKPSEWSHEDYGHGTPAEIVAAYAKAKNPYGIWMRYLSAGKGCPSCWAENRPTREMTESEYWAFDAAGEGTFLPGDDFDL